MSANQSQPCFVLVLRSAPESEDSPVLNAVVRVFDRIVDATNPGLEPAQVFVGRMLLRPPQVSHHLQLTHCSQPPHTMPSFVLHVLTGSKITTPLMYNTKAQPYMQETLLLYTIIV